MTAAIVLAIVLCAIPVTLLIAFIVFICQGYR